MHKLHFLAVLLIVALPLFLGTWLDGEFAAPKASCPHLEAPPNLLQDTLYAGYNELFAASGTCVSCHGHDPEMLASIDGSGNDINLVDDWRSTMMGNSARDPLWRAKVSHEGLVNPNHQETLEDKCTSCHAPLGHFDAHHQGAASYTISDLENDPMGQDGVSCLACHQQVAEGIGTHHSGNLSIDTAKVAYGPYISPLATPMVLESGWSPVYSPHTADAGLCAGCHTLLTETVDLEGNYTGATFVEQATYHEWLNSSYNSKNISCQSCHMPAITKWPVLIAAGIPTAPRTPFYLHELVGANTLMLELMKTHKETLGIPATDEQFDETISKTYEMLQSKSLELNLTTIDRTPDTAYFEVALENLAGHKFPSGYPARRLYLEVLVQTVDGEVLFHSGKLDADYELTQQDPGYEPHYDRITDENQVQIYELVMGDVNGDVTTVLERAATALKDNRLPPLGFSTSHPVYDTTQLAGAVLTDPNFNWDAGLEGTGVDRVQFAVPCQGYPEALDVFVKVYYQSVPLRWLQEMFAWSSTPIDQFKSMYEAADRSPVLIRSATAGFSAVTATLENSGRPAQWPVQPTIGNGERFQMNNPENGRLRIFNLNGQLMHECRMQAGPQSISLNLPAGLYLFQFETEKAAALYTNRIFLLK